MHKLLVLDMRMVISDPSAQQSPWLGWAMPTPHGGVRGTWKRNFKAKWCRTFLSKRGSQATTNAFMSVLANCLYQFNRHHERMHVAQPPKGNQVRPCWKHAVGWTGDESVTYRNKNTAPEQERNTAMQLYKTQELYFCITKFYKKHSLKN